MKFNKRTIEILKNFASINQGLLFREGNVLRSKNVIGTILSEAAVPDVFPKEFAVYDLNEFLSVMSLFQDADVTFEQSYILIKSKTNTVKYFYSSPSVVISPDPTKNITLPSVDVKFTLTAEALEQVLKASAIMKLDTLGISKKGVRAFILNTPASNDFFVDVDMETEIENELQLKIDNLKLIPGEYKVEVCARGIAQFTSVDAANPLRYFVTLEKQ